MPNHIYHLDLKHDGQIVPFAIRTMEDIDARQGGIADLPHRHNYYSVIWPYTATGKHIIDFREYAIETHQIFFVNVLQNRCSIFVLNRQFNDFSQSISSSGSSRRAVCFNWFSFTNCNDCGNQNNSN